MLMKFAIPVIDGLLSSHWGQTSEFLIIEVNDSKQVVGKETMTMATHDCHGTPLALAKKASTLYWRAAWQGAAFGL
jgi:predicted Fe-Mo cluster-binding NifX family protein